MEAKGPAALSNSHPPTHVGAAGTQTRDPGPQGVACTSCPNSGSRRKLSIETSYNRGCPPKQNNPVLGQQPAAGGRAPGELPDLQGSSVAVSVSGHLGHNSSKGDAPAAAVLKGVPWLHQNRVPQPWHCPGGVPREYQIGVPWLPHCQRGCPSHSRTEAGCPGHSTAKGGVP